LKDYKKCGWLDTTAGSNLGSLTIIADNCAGQNKNEDVIRFHMWLVEAGIFPLVRILFLVKGHTKNACDRMFNLLKLDYHKKDIETFEDLHDNLNENEHVDVERIMEDEFFDFSTTLIKYYRHPKAGETTKMHVFTITAERGNTILLKRETMMI
jgi:hypothetical protein